MDLAKSRACRGFDACDRDARTLQCTHQPALVAPGGLEHHQVDIVFLEFRDQHVPSSRVIDRTQFQSTQADIEMLLAYVDSDVRPVIAIRYPTLRMHVHDGQLFGLHGLDETSRCVDQLLTGELNAHRRIRFGAPTAKTTEARGCGQVDSSSYRSNRSAGRGQRFALPTARASAHLPTASHHDYQDNLRIKLNCLLLEDTRGLSSRRTQQVARDLEIGQPINSEECSETADGVTRKSEG